ncbi:HNH endonuclease signature motif containing protein [Corynebacterium frankenforstense]|uniref:HNH endonuclease signature motif containing protein n=1 Tax=Corynebacterium frankenforstense TaxID=1230998 RepID=UPI00095324EB|nr:HNH endonuclease signature motif containing protein [Corynebacterium frankenforstense]
MNPLDQYIEVTGRGIAVAEAAAGLSRHRLIDLGVVPADAQKIARIAGVYFPANRTTSPAIAAARENRHSLATLDMIENYARRVSDQRRAWGFRTRACGTAGNHQAVKEACERLLLEFNGPDAPEPERRPSLRLINSRTRGPGLIFHGSSTQVAGVYRAAVEKARRNLARTTAGSDAQPGAQPGTRGDGSGAATNTAAATGTAADADGQADARPDERTEEDRIDRFALGEAFVEVLAEGVPETVYHAGVGIVLDEHTRILGGDGDDVELLASDGARMTGSEFVRLMLRDRAVVDRAVLVHPVSGPVDLYRLERFASPKQREILQQVYGVCAHPECNRPGVYSEAHHKDSFARGGMTNLDNLVLLCPWHNAANDDDPDAPARHGRIESDGLDVYRRLPGGRRQRDDTPTMARRILNARTEALAAA